MENFFGEVFEVQRRRSGKKASSRRRQRA